MLREAGYATLESQLRGLLAIMRQRPRPERVRKAVEGIIESHQQTNGEGPESKLMRKGWREAWQTYGQVMAAWFPPEDKPLQDVFVAMVRYVMEGGLPEREKQHRESLRQTARIFLETRGHRLPADNERRPTGDYAKLLMFAVKNLKAMERQAVELVCEAGGKLALAELAGQLGWGAPFDGKYNSLQNRINAKLRTARLPWQLARRDNHVLVLKRSQKK